MDQENGNTQHIEKYKQTDSTLEGRDRLFMTLDSWNQDGNYAGRFDDFGPVMEEEAPPTLNGKPVDQESE